MSAADVAAQNASQAIAAADQAEQDFSAGRISEADLHAARNAATDAQNAATDARNAEFLASQNQSAPAPMPQPVQSQPDNPWSAPGALPAVAIVAPSPLAQQVITQSAPRSYPSPAFDINGNLVTIDLVGGDYANLPAGYYETPGQATVARHDQHNTGSNTPITAQQVGALYSDPAPATQAALQQIFSAPPPPPSTYVAPTPPLETGWVTPVVTPPPTPADIIARSYITNGYTPPDAQTIAQIISGEISAPLTTPLRAVLLTAAQYAAQNPDLVRNWARAQNPAWVISHPEALDQVNSINRFSSLYSFLQNQYGQTFDSGALPTVPAEIAAQVAREVPANAEPHQLSEPLPVDNFPAATQTPTNPAAVMPNVLNDTAAFVAGHDGQGNPIMQLVDSAGTLLQWVPAVSNHIDVISGPLQVNVARLIGKDSEGNPVFRMLDTDRNLLQWTENVGQTGFVVAPFYVQSAAAVIPTTSAPVVPAVVPPTAASNGTGGQLAVSPFFDPTHRSIGWDSSGKENFIQIDERGRVITYASDGSNLRDIGAATQGAAATAAALLAANPYKTNPALNTGGTVTNNPTGTNTTAASNSNSNANTTTAGGNSPFFDPTHRSIGWDASGKENFIQIDERGRVITYASDGSNLRDIGAATQGAAATAAALLAANPYKTNPLNGAHPTVTTDSTAKDNSALLIFAAAAVALFAFTR